MSYIEFFKDNSLCTALGIDDKNINEIIHLWKYPHRHYHSERHLIDILQRIDSQSASYSKNDRDILEIAALFHDAVFFPGDNDNEEQSALLFQRITKYSTIPEAQEIYSLVYDTKNRSLSTRLSQDFHRFDQYVKQYGTLSQLLSYEQGIFREFQRWNYLDYKTRRIEFLQSLIENKETEDYKLIDQLIEYVSNRRPQIGLYPGTFSPFHIGHLSILEKAEQMFDKVIVAVGINPDKQTREQKKRFKDVQQTLPFHEVIQFNGFLTDIVQQHESYADITIIRGLRNGNDLDYEVNQLRFMEEQYPKVRTVYLVCDKQYEHISSTAIRNLSKIDPKFAELYKPKKYNYYEQRNQDDNFLEEN